MRRTDEKAAEIHQRIIARLAESDVFESPRALSIAVSGNPDTLSNIRRGHMPNSARLQRIAEALGTTTAWLLNGEEEPAQPATLADPAVLFRHRDVPRDVPIYGTALGADIELDNNGHAHIETTNVETGEIIGYLRRPPGLAGNRKAYALFVVGSSMEPRFDAGQPVFVDTTRPPAIGDDVIVQLINPEEERITVALIKRLVRRNAAYVELEQYNPATRFKIETAKVASIHRVLPIGELLGV